MLIISLYKLNCINFNIKYNVHFFNQVLFMVVGHVLKYGVRDLIMVKNEEW